MTWTKLGDEFIDAADDLTDAEFRTHVEALAYSNRMLADLRIPKRALRRFTRTDDPDRAASGCVAKGWWEDQGDHWWIGCRFREWQQDRAQVELRRSQWTAAKLRKRLHDRGDHSQCDPKNCKHAKEAAKESNDEST